MTEKAKKSIKFAAIGLCAAVAVAAVVLPQPYGLTEETAAPLEWAGGVVFGEEGIDGGISLTSAEIPREAYGEYGIMPIAQNAYTITATVKADSGSAPKDYQFVDFSLNWAAENPAAVTDYVSMTTTDTTATVSLLQAFSTQIVLKVTSRADPDKFRQVTLDYAPPLISYSIYTADSLSTTAFEEYSSLKKVSEGDVLKLHLANGSTKTQTPNPSNPGSWISDIIKLPKTGEFDSVGTIANEITEVQAECKFTESFITYLYTDSCLTYGDQFKISTHSAIINTEHSAGLGGNSGAINQYTLLHTMAGHEDGVTNAAADFYFGDSAFQEMTRDEFTEFMTRVDSAEKPIEVTVTVRLKYGADVIYHFYFDVEVESKGIRALDVSRQSIIFTSDDIP